MCVSPGDSYCEDITKGMSHTTFLRQRSQVQERYRDAVESQAWYWTTKYNKAENEPAHLHWVERLSKKEVLANGVVEGSGFLLVVLCCCCICSAVCFFCCCGFGCLACVVGARDGDNKRKKRWLTALHRREKQGAGAATDRAVEEAVEAARVDELTNAVAALEEQKAEADRELLEGVERREKRLSKKRSVSTSSSELSSSSDTSESGGDDSRPSKKSTKVRRRSTARKARRSSSSSSKGGSSSSSSSSASSSEGEGESSVASSSAEISGDISVYRRAGGSCGSDSESCSMGPEVDQFVAEHVHAAGTVEFAIGSAPRGSGVGALSPDYYAGPDDALF